ncbi:hypothetical protein DFH06DRAFT_1132627 [Mycena polygramma]|nr:hypothetical protein DFH06DRAFT_1132627 [Mycena polygramma]
MEKSPRGCRREPTDGCIWMHMDAAINAMHFFWAIIPISLFSLCGCSCIGDQLAPAACCALVEAPTSWCLRMKVAVSLKPTRTCAFASINTTIIFFSMFRILPTPAQQTSKAPIVHNNADGLYRYTFTALARGRANGRAFKMGNADQIRAAFCRLHGFLDKITRVAGDKDDKFKV